MVAPQEQGRGFGAQLENVVLKLYPKEGAHGKDHALQTAQLVSAIEQEP